MSSASLWHIHTACGRRHPANQDCSLARGAGQGVVLAVADGMGGTAGGGLAAQTAIRLLDRRIDGEHADEAGLVEMIRAAGEKIAGLAAENPSLEGMGTTLTVVVVDKGQASWAHVGDTRLYHLGGGVLTQITRDHRFLQDLLDSGDVSPAELPRHPLRNLLDQCVGCPGLEPDCGSIPVAEGDLLLLTSDGLHDHVEVTTMRRLLEAENDLRDVAKRLAAECVQNGSTDDVTIVLCRIGKQAGAEP